MDMDALMKQQGMRTWTEDERDKYNNDGSELRQMANVIKARLENTHVDGDKNAGHARRRAAKVVRRLNRAIRHLERAAAEMEACNAVYVREVLELPERRRRELERSETRRSRRGLAGGVHETVAKSLDASARAFNGGQPIGNPQVNAAPQPQYVSPYPHQFAQPAGSQQSLPDMADLFVDFPEAL
jgi:hypothetical protein